MRAERHRAIATRNAAFAGKIAPLAPGVRILRPLALFGHEHDHAEIVFDAVRGADAIQRRTKGRFDPRLRDRRLGHAALRREGGFG